MNNQSVIVQRESGLHSDMPCVVKKSDLQNLEVCTISQILYKLSWEFSLLHPGPCSAVTQHATLIYVDPG